MRHETMFFIAMPTFSTCCAVHVRSGASDIVNNSVKALFFEIRNPASVIDCMLRETTFCP